MTEDDRTRRLERLEEALLFAQRDIEQIGGEVVRAFAEIARLRTEIERLEGKLLSAAGTEPFPDAIEDLPPHAMGPRPPVADAPPDPPG